MRKTLKEDPESNLNVLTTPERHLHGELPHPKHLAKKKENDIELKGTFQILQ
jgi:hypothetical protein